MRATRPSTTAARGFTLLEVMVSVAILGLGLTAILSAQFSAVSATAHAKNMSVATGLARCKMSEVEQELTIQGFPEVDMEGAGPCCADDTTANISCSWRVTRPIFPEPDYGSLDLESDLDTSALGALAGGEGSKLGNVESMGDLTSALSGGDMGAGDLGAMAAGGIGGIQSMVMQMVYPELKTIFEASTRRITVVLTWTEGERDYHIELVQWVTQPQPGLDPDLIEQLGGAGQDTGNAGPGSAGPGNTGRGTSGPSPARPGGRR